MKNKIYTGNEYLEQEWVIPEVIYVARGMENNYYNNCIISREAYLGLSFDYQKQYTPVDNKGFVIDFEFVNSRVYSYYRSGCTVMGGKLTASGVPIVVPVRNFLAVMQSQGFTGGRLNGTYRFSVASQGCTKLIPEGCQEDKFKSEISKIFYDPSEKYTSKWKPGHLYISKTKMLFLCMSGEENYYQKYLDQRSMYGLLESYTDTPRKIKIVQPIYHDLLDAIDTKGTGNLEDILELRDGMIYSPKYVGKDLGEFLKPGKLWRDIMPEKIANPNPNTYSWRSSSFYFVNLHEKFADLREPLRKTIISLSENNQNYLDNVTSRNSKAKELIQKDLGI